MSLSFIIIFLLAIDNLDIVIILKMEYFIAIFALYDLSHFGIIAKEGLFK
jgi:hypothetical protein